MGILAPVLIVVAFGGVTGIVMIIRSMGSKQPPPLPPDSQTPPPLPPPRGSNAGKIIGLVGLSIVVMCACLGLLIVAVCGNGPVSFH